MDVAIGSGAYGAKMIGGGFGGSVLALIPGEREATVRSLLFETFSERGWAAPEFLDAVPSPAARRRGDLVQFRVQLERGDIRLLGADGLGRLAQARELGFGQVALDDLLDPAGPISASTPR